MDTTTAIDPRNHSGTPGSGDFSPAVHTMGLFVEAIIFYLPILQLKMYTESSDGISITTPLVSLCLSKQKYTTLPLRSILFDGLYQFKGRHTPIDTLEYVFL